MLLWSMSQWPQFGGPQSRHASNSGLLWLRMPLGDSLVEPHPINSVEKNFRGRTSMAGCDSWQSIRPPMLLELVEAESY
jgi:hypothetical protein